MAPPNPADISRQYQAALAQQKAGALDAALNILEGILAQGVRPAEVLFQVGRLKAQQGDRPAAEAALREALKAKPKEPSIWQALHQVLSGGPLRKLEREAARQKITLGSEGEVVPLLQKVQKGQADDALKQAMALARAAPLAAAPVHAVGVAQAALGQWGPALSAFEEAVRRAPTNGTFIADLGGALLQTGRPEAGLARLAEAEAFGTDVVLQKARGLSETCRDDEALAVLEAAWSQKPRSEIALALARLRAAVRDTNGACDMVEMASGLPQGRNRSAAVRQSVAAAMADAGDHAAAIDLLNETEVSAHALIQRAQSRQTTGDLAGAEADIRHALDLNPTLAEGYRAYANGRKSNADDPVAVQLKEHLARADLPAATRRVMRFAAAKFAADQGDVTAEIDHLSRANRLMADAFPYRFEADLAAARGLASDWDKIKDLAPDGPGDPAIFVTGLPRSGTTLVETILAAHPLVAAGGEMPFLSRALAPAFEALRHGTVEPRHFAEAGARYLRAARRGRGDVCVVADKAISTFSRIGHAALALPGARFVILQRDARDTGLSLWRNMFPEGLHRYAYDQTEMARYIRLHEALVAFWAARLPERVFIVNYEDLTADPEPLIRRLVDFVGLPWDEACLAPQKAKRDVATLSFAQVRQPIGRGSVAGWRKFEAGLSDLIETLDRTEPPDLLQNV